MDNSSRSFIKSSLPLLAGLLLITGISRAQFVTIPDPNFVSFLQSLYPMCMSGSDMDTTCSNITLEVDVDVSFAFISDLEGIQYFDSLKFLTCNNNTLTGLPSLLAPLMGLSCSNNSITSLPALPSTLTALYINNNPITTFPALPLGLLTFHADYCPSIVVPTFGPLLNDCSLRGCDLTAIPVLPSNLNALYIGDNPLASLAGLPSGLNQLYCQNLSLSVLEPLPDGLVLLDADDGTFDSLPLLPSSLTVLSLANNNFSHLPPLPESLEDLSIANNNFSELPTLPPEFYTLNISDNNLYCLPNLSDFLYDFTYFGNPFTCLPNYPEYTATFFPSLFSIPLCENDDIISNPFGCSSSIGITGNIYLDWDSDCSISSGDGGTGNVVLKLVDGATIIAYTGSSVTGNFYFDTDIGSFEVELDTAGVPFDVNCVYPGTDTAVTVSSSDSVITDLNFFIECSSPGIDIGVQSVQFFGSTIPTLEHKLSITAGDLSAWYGLNCAAGLSGVVNIEITGPVEYVGPVSGALTPVVTGLNISYIISDFSSLDIFHDFEFILVVDTLAMLGDTICANITVTPTAGDLDPTNNTFKYCYPVLTAYDPNNKIVHPTVVEPGYDDYLYYTVNFQNLGTAPAINIRLKDTLSSNLDLSTFEMIGYSNPNNWNITDSKLTVVYPNIWLPDSTSDEAASHGYFQYRIKPVAGLPNGTVIDNTAHIYFDYNAPVVTNTTKTYFGFTSDGLEISGTNLKIYPNPAEGFIYIDGIDHSKEYIIEMFDAVGKSIDVTVSESTLGIRLDFDNDNYGIGFLSIRNETESSQFKVVFKLL